VSTPNSSMSRRSKADREAESEAHRIFMPLVFWLFAYFLYASLHGFAGVAPWSRYVAWGGVLVLVVAGLCQVPRAIRTIRGL
jgi:hypothetical protein